MVLTEHGDWLNMYDKDEIDLWVDLISEREMLVLN